MKHAQNGRWAPILNILDLVRVECRDKIEGNGAIGKIEFLFARFGLVSIKQFRG